MGADAWGIADGYHDVTGRWHDALPQSRAAIRQAFGADRSDAPTDPLDGSVRVVVSGVAAPAVFALDLVAEDGATVTVQPGFDLSTLPTGYYDSRNGMVIVAPSACRLPDGRLWGWAVQLYALWSRRSGGIGDLHDLRDFGRWAKQTGADVVLVSPLHAPVPGIPQQASPYFPSSRIFRNPLHLGGGPAFAPGKRIDRDDVWERKRPWLWNEWKRVVHDDGLERFVAEGGMALLDFATHCALVERLGPSYGRDWRQWPAAFCAPGAPAVAAFRTEHPEDRELIRFFAWLQYRLDDQLREASVAIGLIADLAVGIDRRGADAWSDQGLYCQSLAIGAPPDAFNASGQDWGLLPYQPWALRRARYRPFRAAIRAACRHARGVRIDHVMGLFRLWLIEVGSDPRTGCYTYLPFHEYLAIVAIEAERAGVFVVGEDLGTVEPYVREELDRRHILSYRVLQFEPPDIAPPSRSLVAATTHDLATVPGLWTGADVDARRRLGLVVSDDERTATELARDRLAQRARVDVAANVEQAVDAVHECLASLEVSIITATLEDALGVVERPNLPGTIDEWPNWRIPLPIALDDLVESNPVVRTATILSRRFSHRSS